MDVRDRQVASVLTDTLIRFSGEQVPNSLPALLRRLDTRQRHLQPPSSRLKRPQRPLHALHPRRKRQHPLRPLSRLLRRQPGRLLFHLGQLQENGCAPVAVLSLRRVSAIFARSVRHDHQRRQTDANRWWAGQLVAEFADPVRARLRLRFF